MPKEITDRIIDALTIAAPAAESDKAVERLKQPEAAGLDENSLRLHDDPVDSTPLIGERVIPYFFTVKSKRVAVCLPGVW